MISDKFNPINPRLSALYSYTRARLASFIAILFLTTLVASGCVIHDHNHHRGTHHSGFIAVQPKVAVAVPAPVTFTFTDHHRHSVRNYYHEHPHHHGKKHKWKKKKKRKGRKHMPPGLARRDVLPPGIEMQVIHHDLARQLPHPPRGTQYSYYEDQVLLIDLNTRVVLDFINISVSARY